MKTWKTIQFEGKSTEVTRLLSRVLIGHTLKVALRPFKSFRAMRLKQKVRCTFTPKKALELLK